MNLDTKPAYLLLGSNLGNSRKLIEKAIILLAKRVGKLRQQSSYYQTAAWGKTNQPDFLNITLKMDTRLSPASLLKEILAIEQELGRIRHEKWDARLIDIDILFYADEVINTPDLQIPHPEIPHRKFVLIPLAEIAETYLHPTLKKTVANLLKALKDDLKVNQIP